MVKQWFKAAGLLFILWLILSGHYEAKYLILGLLGSMLIGYFCLPLLTIHSGNGQRDFNLLDIKFTAFFGYCLWLVGEIVKSSLSVCAAILSPKMKINPQIIEIDYIFNNPAAVTVFVNSIILTPGTVTIDVIDERIFKVHTLTDAAAIGLMDGEMQRRISRVFER